MIAVRECVFRVQLQLVDLEGGQAIDQRVQRGCGRHLVTRDVQHDAAYRQVGVVPDDASREGTVVQRRELCQGELPVEEPGVVSRGELHRVRPDVQLIALRS